MRLFTLLILQLAGMLGGCRSADSDGNYIPPYEPRYDRASAFPGFARESLLPWRENDGSEPWDHSLD